jgi:hypothetical protein
MNYLGHSALESNATPDITCSDLVPCADLKYDIGSALMQWKSLYVGDVTTVKVKGLSAPTDSQDAVNLLYLRQFIEARYGFSQSLTNDYVFDYLNPVIKTHILGGMNTLTVGSPDLLARNQAVYNFKYDCTNSGLGVGKQLVAGIYAYIGIIKVAIIEGLIFDSSSMSNPFTITGTIQFVEGHGSNNTIVNTNICTTYYANGALVTYSSNGTYTCDTAYQTGFSLHMDGTVLQTGASMTVTRRTGVVSCSYYPNVTF